MTMGIGISAICLNTLSPYLPLLHTISAIIWLWNILLFTVFIIVFVIKTCLYPGACLRMLNHATQAMFLGCIPMGLSTILAGFILFGIDLFGEVAILIAYTLWWIDLTLALISVLLVPMFMFTKQEHSLNTMNSVWLLPFVACWSLHNDDLFFRKTNRFRFF